MSSDIRKALDLAASDPTIKAVVLRVDSPGGSAVASEIILDATKRVKAKKPFVVSMGNVAGSGGYYVSCAADTIFADEATITASIGVVAGKMVTNAMWDKVGITWKPYERGANAHLFSSSAPWSDSEKQRIQSWMDEVYKQFKGHVTAIRGDRLKKPIDELAGGRVFTGKQALELGLVDKIGTLQDAVVFVAKQANLTDYDTRVVPQPKNLIEMIMESASGGSDDDPNHKWIDSGRAPRLFATGSDSFIDLALAHLQHLDPQRVQLVREALLQLQLMQKEGVIMMMTPIATPR
jgi:protease-4